MTEVKIPAGTKLKIHNAEATFKADTVLEFAETSDLLAFEFSFEHTHLMSLLDHEAENADGKKIQVKYNSNGSRFELTAEDVAEAPKKKK